MLSIKVVNKAIASHNIKAEIVRGSGYFYFVGEDVEYAFSTSVMVPRLNDLTLDQWIEEVVAISSESKEVLEGDAECSFPSWIPKTNQERVQDIKRAYLDAVASGEHKLDGSSFAAYVING